ncbi:MAG: phage tail protein [Myxococcaceae bacterium]
MRNHLTLSTLIGFFVLSCSQAGGLQGEPGPEGPQGAAGSSALAPAGAVVAFAGGSAPEGWLMCDGALVSRTRYPALFAAIGVAHGSGDGSTTFQLPDYRGRFLRGVDMGMGRDPDRAARGEAGAGGNTGDQVGSVQDHELGAHQHELNHGNGGRDQVINSWLIGNNQAFDPSGNEGAWMGGSTATSGGTETRPVNANVFWIIKS